MRRFETPSARDRHSGSGNGEFRDVHNYRQRSYTNAVSSLPGSVRRKKCQVAPEKFSTLRLELSKKETGSYCYVASRGNGISIIESRRLASEPIFRSLNFHFPNCSSQTLRSEKIHPKIYQKKVGPVRYLFLQPVHSWSRTWTQKWRGEGRRCCA